VGGWILRKVSPDWDVFATFHKHPKEGQGATWVPLDLENGQGVDALFKEIRPQVVIHTAALNPGKGEAFREVNTEGTKRIAQAAKGFGCRLIHVSTDMVFDGEKGNYKEEDPVCPLTEYGRSKAMAEEAVLEAQGQSVIVRTSLVYGWKPTLSNSGQWILDNLAAGKPVRLFTDERRCPIWVETLAEALLEVSHLSIAGILHVAGAQILSRYEFGVRLLTPYGIDLSQIETANSRDMGVKRPPECTLDSSRAKKLLRTPLPGMDEVLEKEKPVLLP